jgi:pimeloyl-ACP methyl ester carboxylesterase
MAFFTTSDGRRLYYESTGTGPTLLCLSGLTRNCRDFDPLRPHLPELRLITMDYRGRGRSEFDPDHANYNVFREARDAVELLDLLGIPKTTVLGTSRGGLIAMVLAASHAGRLGGAILNDVGPEIDPAGIARIMEYLGQPPEHADLDSLARAMQQSAQAQFPGVPLAVWRRQAAAQYRAADGRLHLRYDANLRRAILEAAASETLPDMWLFFRALKALPLGLIHGANSDILNMDIIARMQTEHPKMAVVHVPDRGHVPFLDEAESLAMIRQILERST